MDEDVFERRFTYAERLNLSREGFDHFWDKVVSILNFKADPIVHYSGIDLKPVADTVG